MINNINLSYILNNSYHNDTSKKNDFYLKNKGLILGIVIYILYDFNVEILSLNFFNLFFIFLCFDVLVINYKRSNINLGFDDVIKKVISSSIVVLKKNSIKKKKIKNSNKEYYDLNKNLFESKLTDEAIQHLMFMEIVVSNNIDYNLYVSNFTKSNKNSIKIADKGILHENNDVYVHNENKLIFLHNNLDEIKEFYSENVDSTYTEKVQTNIIISTNLNKHIESIATLITGQEQKIFAKNKSFNDKIEDIKNYKYLIDKVNSRED